MSDTQVARARLLSEAYAYGYRIEFGSNLTNPKLLGMFWWSLSREDCDIKVSEGEWGTRREAEDAVIVAHAAELMEP